MGKQILVKTPLTTNGTDPVFGNDGKLVYSESILSDNGTQSGARAILEKRNHTLPQHLKLIITDVEETPPAAKKEKATA